MKTRLFVRQKFLQEQLVKAQLAKLHAVLSQESKPPMVQMRLDVDNMKPSFNCILRDAGATDKVNMQMRLHAMSWWQTLLTFDDI